MIIFKLKNWKENEKSVIAFQYKLFSTNFTHIKDPKSENGSLN